MNEALAREISEEYVKRMWNVCGLKVTSLIIRNSPEGPKAYFEGEEYLGKPEEKPTVKEIYSERPQPDQT